MKHLLYKSNALFLLSIMVEMKGVEPSRRFLAYFLSWGASGLNYLFNNNYLRATLGNAWPILA